MFRAAGGGQWEATPPTQVYHFGETGFRHARSDVAATGPCRAPRAQSWMVIGVCCVERALIGARVIDEMFAFDIDLRVKPLFDPSVPHRDAPLVHF